MKKSREKLTLTQLSEGNQGSAQKIDPFVFFLLTTEKFMLQFISMGIWVTGQALSGSDSFIFCREKGATMIR